MVKRVLLFFLLLCLIVRPSFADPLSLGVDLAGTCLYPEDVTPEEAVYVYSYRYPCIEGDDPAASVINDFYAYIAEDAEGFTVPMTGDELEAEDGTGRTDISYEVTCNNDQWFSLKVVTDTVMTDREVHSIAGHTFARSGGRPGSSVSLPYYLDILSNDVEDTWLQDRQTAKADRLVREMILDRLASTADREGLTLIREIDPEEIMENWFFPEEDFYLDENGDPVFFILPGVLTVEDGKALLFSITREEIMDEL